MKTKQNPIEKLLMQRKQELINEQDKINKLLIEKKQKLINKQNQIDRKNQTNLILKKSEINKTFSIEPKHFPSSVRE